MYWLQKAMVAVMMAATMLSAVRAAEKQATIAVHADQIKGQVNRDLFGTELKCAFGCQGLMADDQALRSEIMQPIQELGTTFVRFKFMRDQWCWSQGIGPLQGRGKDRRNQRLFGVDEIGRFMELVKSTDPSKIMMVVRAHKTDAQQGAALVAYLNTPVEEPEKNRHTHVIGKGANGIDYRTVGYWAKLRAAHGHARPYGVKYFEMGNETYMKNAGFEQDPSLYCQEAKAVVDAMKAVDPAILCGLNFESYPGKQQAWREGVIREGGLYADFFVNHAYYPFGKWRNEEYHDDPELYYKMVMAGAHQAISDWRYVRDLMRELIPSRADRIPLCLTENGFHLDDRSAEKQNTVLVGVYDCDEIGMMVEHADELKLDAGMLFYLTGDDHWSFIHQRFGEREPSEDTTVRLRPPYYALYMWTHYFGTELLRTEVEAPTFGIPDIKGTWPENMLFWSRIAVQDGIPLLAAHSSLSADGKNLYLIVINRDLHDGMRTNVDLKGFQPKREAQVFTLSTSATAASPKLVDRMAAWDSHNEENPTTVKIRQSRISNEAASFTYSYPAHSATALILTREE